MEQSEPQLPQLPQLQPQIPVQPIPVPPIQVQAAPDKPCAIHKTVQALNRCIACGKRVCPTCDFIFPGNLHFCPACVVLPPPPVSQGRNTLAVLGIIGVIAALCSWGAMLTGSFAGSSPDAIGNIFTWLIFMPSVAAFGLSLSAIDRKLGNNVLLWISLGFSSLMFAVLMTMVIVGNLNK